jgi:glycosyltransferase involved in cell wall biosynthesis
MSQGEVRVSFIIPMLNAEETIETTLKSIFHQKNLPPFEVIVIDNGSSDESLSILNFFPCILLHETKRGAGAARNRGLEVARGRYVAFIDSDVELHEEWLKESLKILENSIFVGTQGKIIPTSFKKNSFLHNFRLNYNKLTTDCTYNHLDANSCYPIINTAACLYRRDWLQIAKGFDSSLLRCEDGDLTKKIFALGGHLKVSHAEAWVYWNKSLLSYINRFISIGKYHVILKKIWQEDFKIQFNFNRRAALVIFNIKELALYYLIRIFQTVGNILGLFYPTDLFDSRRNYLRENKENLIILNLSDDKGQTYSLAPWIRVLRKSEEYVFFDLKLQRSSQLPSSLVSLLDRYLDGLDLNFQENQNLLFFFKERSLVI